MSQSALDWVRWVQSPQKVSLGPYKYVMLDITESMGPKDFLERQKHIFCNDEYYLSHTFLCF